MPASILLERVPRFQADTLANGLFFFFLRLLLSFSVFAFAWYGVPFGVRSAVSAVAAGAVLTGNLLAP